MFNDPFGVSYLLVEHLCEFSDSDAVASFLTLSDSDCAEFVTAMQCKPSDTEGQRSLPHRETVRTACYIKSLFQVSADEFSWYDQIVRADYESSIDKLMIHSDGR